MALRGSRSTRKLNPGVYARPDGKLQAHIAIPVDVQFAYGRSKRVLSLGTADPAEANRRHAQMVAEHNAAFDLIRRGSASKAFEDFARRLHASQTEAIEGAREGSFVTGRDNLLLYQGWRERLDSQDPEELAATVGWAADWFYAEQMGVDPDDLPRDLRESRAYRQIMRECAEVLKDSWFAGRAIEAGQTVPAPRYPALAKQPDESADGNRATDDRATWPISRYHEEAYLPAKAGALEPNSVNEKRHSIRLFNDLIGDPAVFMVTRAQITDFQDQLKHVPDGRALLGDLKDKSLKELVALQASGSLNLKRMGATTIDKHVRNLKTVLSHAQKKGHMRLNPAVGVENVKPTAANPVHERRRFTRSELEAIFAHPIFAGCEADTLRGKFRPGPVLIRDERFWLPVLLFLTGARASEIAGLEKSDVTFTDSGARLVFQYSALRRLKNPESERVIPLHHWAMRMGFAEYVASLPEDTPYLFPNIVSDTRDGATGEMSDASLEASPIFRGFNRTILKHVGMAADPGVSLHSFRHTFESAMIGLEISDETMFRLTGRAISGSRRGYTGSLPHDEEERERVSEKYRSQVGKIDFGGVNIENLFMH